MAAEARRARIVDLARAHGIVRVTDLVAEFNVSTMTVRRDLTVLAERGVIERVHGGAVIPGASIHRPDRVGFDRSTSGALDQQPADLAAAIGTVPAAPAHVGIVVPSGHYYFPTIVDGARRLFDARSVRRALAVSGYDSAQDRVLIEQLLAAGSTGLLLAPNIALGDRDPERVSWLFELPVPVVLVERTVHAPERDVSLCSVRTDAELGAERAVRHLARLGHAGVALVTQGSSQAKSRVINGWRAAVSDLGLDPDRSAQITTKPEANMNLWPTNEAIDAVLDELAAVTATAVLVHSDQTALALVHHARGRGWRIPDDLSVIAYDNEIAEMADPPLTAVSPPRAWVGWAAAEMFLRMTTDGTPGPVRHIVAEPELVVRESTAPPRCTSSAS